MRAPAENERRKEAGRTLKQDESPEPGVPPGILAVLAHELSSPVSVIRGFADALISDHGTLPDAERRRFLDAITRGADQLAALITMLTDVHGVEAGTLDVNAVPLDLGALVALTVKDMSTVMPAHEVTATLIDAVVPVDVVRIRQVLVNLLTNARKFSPLHTSIEVTMRRTNGSVEIVVTDQGHGVPPEKRDRLFQKFSRLSDSHVVGMGLGLYISRGIMRAHGGDLTYEPTDEEGSRFIMRLPIA